MNMRSTRIISVVVLMLVAGIPFAAGIDGCDTCGGYDGPFDWDAYYDSIGWGSSGGSGGSGGTGSGGDNSGAPDTTDSGTSGDSGNSGTGTSSSESGGSSYVSGGSAEDGLLLRIKGDQLFSQGLYDEALTAYQEATLFDPYSLRSWKGKGMALQALGRYDDAAGAFQKALKLDPGDVSARVLLGDALFDAGEYGEAIGQYARALGMNPNLQGVPQKISAASALALGGTEPPEEIPEPGPEETITVPVTTLAELPPETADLPRQQTAPFPGAFGITAAFLTGFLILASRKR